ncbi:hypothetical protein ACFY4C_20960 [Actinomadura viridis]|uniref:hypothetical protein n=1 Tax=Actinomadura viridis TaxID=58110 RepID=UPI0036942E6B
MNVWRRLVCRNLGRHAWKHQAAETAINGRVCGPWIYCAGCGITRKLQAEPPFEHPDSMTAELPAEQEEWLAAIDAALWPREAV